LRKNKQFNSPRLPLNPDLERAVLCGVIKGEVSIEKVHKEELSKEGQYIWTAIKAFPSAQNVSFKSVYLHCTEVLGADHADFREFLKEVEQSHAPQVETVLETLSRKAIINDLVNEASVQIAAGDYSLLALKGLLQSHTSDRNTLTPLSEDMHDVTPPVGLEIPGMDAINEKVGGLFGLWIISGMPAAGKSTLALMISCLMSAIHRPVLYYDFEQGKSVIRWHVHKALQDRTEKQRKAATNRLYIRSNIGLLERDLEMVKEPCVVVVDSIQKVAKGITYRRESLEGWIHKLEGLKQYGHHVILVSEKNRAGYGQASMEGYKESGELEYAADAAFDLLLPDEKDSSVVDVHVVKNRHHKFHGHLTTIDRVNSWWFKDRYKKSKEID
jgi:hypothetical protein